MLSMSGTSSSSCPGVGTPWSKEWYQHFLPTCCTEVPSALGLGGVCTTPLSTTVCTDPLSATACASPLSTTPHSWAVADIPRMVANGTLPVRSCREYRSVPWVSSGQVHMATPKASTKAWESCPSFTFISHSSANTLSP